MQLKNKNVNELFALECLSIVPNDFKIMSMTWMLALMKVYFSLLYVE